MSSTRCDKNWGRLVSDDLWWEGIIPPTKPRPNEKLWELWARHKLFSCELKYRGEYGVEAQIFEDAEFVWGRLFQTRELAVNWATLEKEFIEKGGD
jgi:hypothetical protein